MYRFAMYSLRHRQHDTRPQSYARAARWQVLNSTGPELDIEAKIEYNDQCNDRCQYQVTRTPGEHSAGHCLHVNDTERGFPRNHG